MPKPTALAAFAAKQQRIEPLDGLSKTEVKSSGRTLSKVKVPVLGGEFGGEVGANVKPLTKSTSIVVDGDVSASPARPLGVLGAIGDGQGSFFRKVVASPRNSTESDKLETRATARTAKTPSLKPLAPVDNENHGNTDEADHLSTPDESSQTEQEKKSSKSAVDNNTETRVKDTLVQNEETQKREIPVSDSKPHGKDQSDDDDFNFDDVDADEKGDVEPLTQQVEPLEMKASMVDAEDLYDCPPDNSEDALSQEKSVVQPQPKMFLPRASDIELFHVVLTDDISQLKLFLEGISPQEMLKIVDTTGRTLYHYAALSKNKLTQNMIFQHVATYRDKQFNMEVQALMRKKQHVNAWMHESQTKGGGWIPPRLRELQRETTKKKWTDWASICISVDDNGRSLFHYLASTSGTIPVEEDYEFCSVLRSRHDILSTKDHFKKLALHYAVENGNIKQVKWHFHMGVKLNQADVDLLLSFNVSRVMENVILRQLEAIDMKNYYLPTCTDAATDPCDPGVSTFALAKLQRVTDDSAGRLHQFPLHRAAMFGNIRAVELLLEEGADPNAQDVNQWTALHYCAAEASPNHLAIAQLLTENPKCVDINARSLKGRSALHVAARSRKRNLLHEEDNSTESSESEGRVSFVAYLHVAKADLDLKDAKGATPLLLACQMRHLGVVQFLLNAGCDPTTTGENKWNALHFAASRGDANIVSLLQSWDADSRLWMNSQDKQGRKPIDVANDSIRRILVNLWTESYSGNVNQVRCLLLARSKQNSQAIQQTGSLSVKGKTVQTERTPLHLAVLGYSDALQLLETSSTRASSREELFKQTKASELKRTAPSRYLQVVILLLQAGADLGAADKWGITPLMLAARLKDSIFMETLLDRTANESDLQAADVDGNTALHYSYAFCQAQVSTLLEDQMDDADIENKQGKSPFEMTGYGKKIYPKEYREFLKRQQELRRRQIGRE